MTVNPARPEPGTRAGNLNLANMDWEDFADAADEDRVFRGFVG